MVAKPCRKCSLICSARIRSKDSAASSEARCRAYSRSRRSTSRHSSGPRSAGGASWFSVISLAVCSNMTPSFSQAQLPRAWPSVARDISALRAAISRTNMHRTRFSVLRPGLCAQIAFWRLLRKIQKGSPTLTASLAIILSIEINTSLPIAVLCRSGIDGEPIDVLADCRAAHEGARSMRRVPPGARTSGGRGAAPEPLVAAADRPAHEEPVQRRAGPAG